MSCKALNGGEDITLAAGGGITLASAEAYNSSFKEVKTKSSGFFGSKKSTKTNTSESLTNLGTSLTSGGDIPLLTGHAPQEPSIDKASSFFLTIFQYTVYNYSIFSQGREVGYAEV